MTGALAADNRNDRRRPATRSRSDGSSAVLASVPIPGRRGQPAAQRRRGAGVAEPIAIDTTDDAVQVRDLRMRYGPKDVLTGVDFDVHRGEVVCLLGPNGAGKTTTIEILEGFRLPSAGVVRVLGADPAHGDEDWRARTGVVLQSWRDHPQVDASAPAHAPRRLLRAVLHTRAAASVRGGGAARDGRPDRARRPEDRDPVRRAASPAGRRDRHRRPARAAVPRRADRRVRPARPA